MSTTNSISKKRKRDATPEPHFKVSEVPVGKVGPILVSYPTVEPTPSTSFKCYSRKRQKDAKTEDESLIVVGETPTVEFVTNEEETRRVASSGCKYLIAARNNKTGSIYFYPAPKSPHIVSRTVKSLKSLPSQDAPSKVQYTEAKNLLGETFGSKKAKASIRAQERNRIDVRAMEGVMDHVMDSINKGAEGLMTTAEMKEASDNNRLIPQFDAITSDPADIYPLHNIIIEAEWKALSVSAFDAATTDKERNALLPYRRSDWLHQHLKSLSESPSKSKKRNLKILLYISTMLAFRQQSFQKTLDKEKLYERLSGIPTIVVDGLLSRFAETARGSSVYQATSATKTNLLTHMFALCLRVDKYTTNTKVLAHDLSMPVSEVNQLFKSLGCKIVKLGEQERRKHGLAVGAADEKHAVLNAPVEFPKPRRQKK